MITKQLLDPTTQAVLAEFTFEVEPTPEDWSAIVLSYFPIPKTQYEKDISRYTKRAEAKDAILAEMAAENMSRVRNGTWSIPQLMSLTQDLELKQVLSNIDTLSFEIAAGAIMQLTNPLLTPQIKQAWAMKLSSHFYLNG
jgi:hypothetical protein